MIVTRMAVTVMIMAVSVACVIMMGMDMDMGMVLIGMAWMPMAVVAMRLSPACRLCTARQGSVVMATVVMITMIMIMRVVVSVIVGHRILARLNCERSHYIYI
jgi:hypothetical protein